MTGSAESIDEICRLQFRLLSRKMSAIGIFCHLILPNARTLIANLESELQSSEKLVFLRRFLDEMQTAAMMFLHLFQRANSSAKVSELGELLLDCL